MTKDISRGDGWLQGLYYLILGFVTLYGGIKWVSDFLVTFFNPTFSLNAFGSKSEILYIESTFYFMTSVGLLFGLLLCLMGSLLIVMNYLFCFTSQH